MNIKDVQAKKQDFQDVPNRQSGTPVVSLQLLLDAKNLNLNPVLGALGLDLGWKNGAEFSGEPCLKEILNHRISVNIMESGESGDWMERISELGHVSILSTGLRLVLQLWHEIPVTREWLKTIASFMGHHKPIETADLYNWHLITIEITGFYGIETQ